MLLIINNLILFDSYLLHGSVYEEKRRDKRYLYYNAMYTKVNIKVSNANLNKSYDI